MTSFRIPLTAAALLACGLAQAVTSPQGPEPASFSALSAPAMPDAGVVMPFPSDGHPQQDDAQALLAEAALFGALHKLGLPEPEFAPDADLAELALVAEAYTALGLNGVGGSHDATDAPTQDDSGTAPAYWAFQMPSHRITAADPELDLLETGSGAGMYWDANEFKDELFVPYTAQTAFLGTRLSPASITLPPGTDLTLTDVGDAASASVYSPVSAVPEPAISPLMLLGLGWIGHVLVKRRRRAA